MKPKTLTCNQPDRDVPSTICGYPLPCPYHTVTINSQKITIPPQSPEQHHKSKLKQLRTALLNPRKDDG